MQRKIIYKMQIILLINKKMQGTDFNLEAMKEHKKIAFKQGYVVVAEHLWQASIAPTEQSPTSCAQVNMPKNILEIEYLSNNLFDNNVHDIAMQPANRDTDHTLHHEAPDVPHTIHGGAHFLFKTNYVIINTI